MGGQRGRLGHGSLVVDLAAGTGQLSRRFSFLGVRLVAIEPARNMRSVIQERLPTVLSLDGSAERIPLPDHEAHAVVVGNAFHHLDAKRAFGEVRRVLRPGGALAIFWAWPADDRAAVPWLRLVEEAVEDAVEGVPAAKAITGAYRSWRQPPTRVEGFTSFERSEFPTMHAVPSARLADLYATSSDVASLPSTVRTNVLERIREICSGLPEVLVFSTRSVVDMCFREFNGDPITA